MLYFDIKHHADPLPENSVTVPGKQRPITDIQVDPILFNTGEAT
jgi:hypothetical protein